MKRRKKKKSKKSKRVKIKKRNLKLQSQPLQKVSIIQLQAKNLTIKIRKI